ncbi:MAG: hypothetical protein O3B01_29710 [Planctomycetota bacterium]|nr:hypothetical protein [Planctomycetota bacterium]MDA1142759.1 hypothetical protein [Planctomycetota bacterium]
MRKHSYISLFALFLSGCLPVEPYEDAYETRPKQQPIRELPDSPFRTNRVPPGNVSLSIETFEVEAKNRELIELALRYRDNNVKVGVGALGGKNGLVIYGAKGGLSGAMRATASSSSTNHVTTQSLLVAIGSYGVFKALRSEIGIRTIQIPVYRGTVVISTILERVTGSGLGVKIYTADNEQVDAEVMPFFRRSRDGSVLGITQLKTRIMLIPGNTYVLMSHEDSSQTLGNALLTYERNGQRRKIIQLVTARVGE